MTTIWQVHDRQGVKHFSSRPQFASGHDIFVGERCGLHRKARIIRKFKAVVTGRFAIELGYPTTMQVTPQPQTQKR